MATLNLFSVTEAADKIGVCPSRVRQFCLHGRLGQRIGGRWVISEEEIRSFKKIPRPHGKKLSAKQP